MKIGLLTIHRCGHGGYHVVDQTGRIHALIDDLAKVDCPRCEAKKAARKEVRRGKRSG